MTSPVQTDLRLHLFGGPELRVRGAEAVGLTPTQELLLTLVWGQEEAGITRSRTIWLLWEEEDSARTRQRLRQVLHEVRRRLGVHPVAAAGEDVLLPATDLLASDLGEFREALGRGALRTAQALEERGFATHLRRPPGQEYDDWLTAKRAGLRRELREAAARAWDAHQPRGEWLAARSAAEVLHALDPTGEPALRRLIEARAMTGAMEAAEAAFASYVELLRPGEEPDTRTLDLLERVRGLSRERRPSGRKSSDPPPLVGRGEELKTARRMLERVRSGSFELLLLTGEAGVGKTRILEELRKEGHLRGFRCLHAHPVELERRIPLNPLVDALGHPDVADQLRSLEDPWKAVIAAILPQLPPGMERPVVPPIAESSLSRRLCDAFSILFTQMAEDEPTLLFLDDLQWADATTVTVLQFVQRRWRGGPLGIVATLRPDLVKPKDVVAKYLREDGELPATHVEIQELSGVDAKRLVRLVADGALDDRTCDRLLALGGRNPFYLIELTRDRLAGHLEMPEMPSDALLIPISIRQLLDPRIEALSPGARQLASYLSVWGRWARISDLAALTGTEADLCAGHVEELEDFRLATVDRDRVRLAHELFRGALYHGLSQARRALLHRAVGEYLEQTDQPQLGELAIHFSRAGDAAQAAVFGRRAADAALENGAMAGAAYFLQVVTENESDPVLKAEATGDLARVLHMSRDIARANPLLELAATRLRAVGNHAQALRMDIRRVEGLAEEGAAPMSDLLDRLESIKQAARQASDDEALALALDSQLHLLHRSGEVTAIRKLFTEMRVCADSEDPAAACVANASLALNALFGDGEEALVRAREAVRIAEEEGVEDHALKAQSRLVLVLIYQGLLGSSEGTELLRRASARAERSGDLTLRFYLESNRGVYNLDIGELDAAEPLLDAAVAMLKKTEPGTPHLNWLYNRAELCIARGQYEEALDFLKAAPPLITPSAPVYLADLISAAAGVCELRTGRLAIAREREEQLRPDPEFWYYDPTIVMRFRTRLLAKRGRHTTAIEMIHTAGESVRGRLIPAWLKLILLEGTLRRRTIGGLPPNLEDAIQVAERLGLTKRKSQLTALLDG
jgi:DNA-binding SARP family transcriptional activator/tetratricopeptide (TPR) repeat protein